MTCECNITFLKVLSLFAALNVIDCSNILFLNGIASPSHHLWNRVLIRGLARKGHNITMVSVDDDKNPDPNIHYIFMEKAYEELQSGENPINYMEMAAEQNKLAEIVEIQDFCDINCDGILKSRGLDVILNYPNEFKFDAVVYDFTCGPCLLPLIHKFNYPPLISVTAFGNPPFSVHLSSDQNYPSYVPHYTTTYPQRMSFPQRICNTFWYAFESV